MARKFAALAERSNRLGAELFELMPQLYKDRANNGLPLSPINAAWNEAMLAVSASHRAIETLNGMLTERAEAKVPPDICPLVASPILGE